MSYHPVTTQITNLLSQHGVWFETFEHEPVLTSQAAAELRDGYTLHQGAKAIIVCLKIPQQGKKFVILVVPGDLRFSAPKVKQLFGAKDIRFATAEEVAEITAGVLPGGIPPFGQLFGLELIVDPSVLANEKIIFNAGDRSFSVGMKSEDYQRVVEPRIEMLV